MYHNRSNNVILHNILQIEFAMIYNYGKITTILIIMRKENFMKKMRISILTTVAIACITSSQALATVGVFLENNYGATLKYRTTQAQPTGELVGTNTRVFLGDADFIPELSIKRTGIGSDYFSYYYDLTDLLQNIKNQQHSNVNNNAIIVVHPSRIRWNVDYKWEPKVRIESFEYAQFVPQSAKPVQQETTSSSSQTIISTPIVSAPVNLIKEGQKTPEEIEEEIEEEKEQREAAFMKLRNPEDRLEAIKNGALGTEYAQKTIDICSANYAQAERLGKVNLCKSLKRGLSAPVYRRHRDATGQRPNLAPTLEDIKNNIDTLHKALARYKVKGDVQ